VHTLDGPARAAATVASFRDGRQVGSDGNEIGESMDGTPATIDTESAVSTRYEKAARVKEVALCCPVTFRILTGAPYADEVVPVTPRKEIPLSRAKPFDCNQNAVRSPAETKGRRYKRTEKPAAEACGPGGNCR
jgi:hypothetical protein